VSELAARRRMFLRARVALLAMVMVGAAGAVVRRAWDLQVERASTLRAMAEEQYLRDIDLTPKRGTIYDRDGAELAVSVDVDSVWANPTALKKAGHDPRVVAHQLAQLLGVDAEILTQRLSSDRRFVWIKRRVTPAQGKVVRGLRIAGVATSGEARRFYPNRELAAHVLGFADVDGKGIEGLELALDERLRGSAQAVPALLDRRGEVVFSERLLDDGAARGDDITLTIDKTLQHVAERELELAVHTYEARGGSIVMLDPSTGEILALANYPTFNPNEPARSTSGAHRNRAVTDRYEPGSTIKPFTIAGALAAGALSPRQTIDCQDGAMRVAQYTIHDTHKWQLLTPAEIIAVSSNIGTAKAGLLLGRAGLYRALTRFGFGEATGLGLPGETAGILRHYKRWYDMDAATVAFGQGMSATTVQLAAAFGSLANKGRLLHPTVIRRVVDARGTVVQQATPRVRRQVVPESVARQLTDMLVGVTTSAGTAPEAAIEGYLVAGKTGTAQKADYVRGGYAKGKWTSSFIGFAPAQSPRVVTAVIIDEPVIAHHGGSVAGPVFRRVTEVALRQLGALPEASATLGEAKKLLSAAAPKMEAAGAEMVSSVVPAEPVVELALKEGELLVPSVVGKSARAAIGIARRADFDVRVDGTGIVIAQSPVAGSIAVRGAVLELRLGNPSEPSARAPSVTEDSRAQLATPVSPAPTLVSAVRGGEGG
jgi:cell division protein FtsI (penicillin-binding protein 3)